MASNEFVTPVIRAPDAGHVYLSFDDGPDAEWTPRVLDALAAANARATFFVIGAHAQASPQLVRRAVAEGHDIGNHTWSHRHPWCMSPDHARREVRDGAAAIAAIAAVAAVAGCAPKLFRPPHGRLRSCMVEEAADTGQITVLWSMSAIDWGPLGRAHRIAGRLTRVASGDIVLLHDGRHRRNKPAELMAVLPSFLAHLRARRLETAALASATLRRVASS